MKFLVLAIFTCLLSACSSNSQKVISKIELTVLHTNDHHGHYWPDEKKGRWGGMPARKTLVDKIRKDVKAKGGHVLLLSGGDINTGTLESDIYNAKPDFLGMKDIGYDAMALGNHEFDNDLKILKQQITWAGFPVLSANIYEKKSKNRFVPGFIIKQFGGIKIGILGLTTTDTPQKASSTEARKHLDFKNVILESKKVVRELKNMGVDIIIAVTHMGHKGSATAEGDIKLAEAIPEIDIVVGGHSQQIVRAEKHGNAIIVQAQDWGKYLGHLKLNITKTTDKTSTEMAEDYKLIPINLKSKNKDNSYTLIEKEIPENQKLKDLLSPYYYSAKDKAKTIVAWSEMEVPFTFVKMRSRPTVLGQFVGDAMRKRTQADLAIINGGGIRSGLEKGEIQFGLIHNIHPYGNTIASVSLNAEELYEYIKFSLSFYHAANNPNRIDLGGGYPHYAGASIKIKDKNLIEIKAHDGSWKISKNSNGTISARGKELFVISISSFQAAGGDGYADFRNRPSYVDSGYTINKAVEDILLSQPKQKTPHGLLPVLTQELFNKYSILAKKSIIDNITK